MIILLLGQDIYSKQAFLQGVISKKGLVSIKKYLAEDNLPDVNELAGQTLFGESVAHIFEYSLASMEEDYLEQLTSMPSSVFLIEGQLDNRTQKAKFIKTNQKSGRVVLKDFPEPTGNTAIGWITEHAKLLDCKIEPPAASLLVEYLIGSNEDALPVVRAHQELLKLKSLADGQTITPEMVESLVVPEQIMDVFTLTDAITGNRKAEAVELLQRYYQYSGEDEKSASIKLVGILAEQWRSLLIAQDFVARGVPEEKILKKTGWKSGRLFIMKKLSRNIEPKKLISALDKLSHLDTELKTSTLPSRVIVDMIITTLT